jgi:hypothetical protein
MSLAEQPLESKEGIDTGIGSADRETSVDGDDGEDGDEGDGVDSGSGSGGGSGGMEGQFGGKRELEARIVGMDCEEKRRRLE